MIIDVETYLEHHGVKGMKWGIRHTPDGILRSTDRAARKDAEEFARAKLFYGEGAGTRRKLIKATVDAKKAKDASYAKAFDRHLANQDLSKHASKARSERSRKDKSKTVKKTSGAIARRITGEFGTAAAFVGLAAAGAAYLKSPKGQHRLNSSVSAIRRAAASRRGAAFVKQFNDLVVRSGLG